METTPHPLYSPSWLDQFTEWVEHLPGQSWLFYPALGIVSALIMTAVNWYYGSYPIGTFRAFHIWLPIQIPYLLALIWYLDRAAIKTLESFRPALEVSEEEFVELRYRLTNAPSTPTLLGSIVGLAVAIMMIPLYPMYISLLGFSKGLISNLAYGFTFAILGVAGGVVYHTIHQLRLVRQIYAEKAKVNLYDLSPLYAFSSLTSQTSVALIIYTSVWFSSAPELLFQTVGILFGVFYTVVAIVIFIWPLLGIHGRLVHEKQRLLRESSQLIETTINDFQARAKAGELHEKDELQATKAALEILEIARGTLIRIPTWPWQPETLRGFVSALLLPLVLLVLQVVLQRFFV